jgi:hypothetical protein
MLDVDVASHVASPHRAALPWPLPKRFLIPLSVRRDFRADNFSSPDLVPQFVQFG